MTDDELKALILSEPGMSITFEYMAERAENINDFLTRLGLHPTAPRIGIGRKILTDFKFRHSLHWKDFNRALRAMFYEFKATTPERYTSDHAGQARAVGVCPSCKRPLGTATPPGISRVGRQDAAS